MMDIVTDMERLLDRRRRRRPFWSASISSSSIISRRRRTTWLTSSFRRCFAVIVVLGSTWLCSVLHNDCVAGSQRQCHQGDVAASIFAEAFSSRVNRGSFNQRRRRTLQPSITHSAVSSLGFRQRFASQRATTATTTSKTTTTTTTTLYDATIEHGLSSLDLTPRSLMTSNPMNGTSLHHNTFMNHFASDATSSSSSTSSDTPSFSTFSFLHNQSQQLFDVPMPTVNGGYSHTTASKAKISQANKGREPWNKGRSHGEDVKARIAAGVRAKNRERFLQKLQSLNMTEAEYEQQEKEKQDRVEADRSARRTEHGGYRPTEETRQKISQVLKTKYANGTFHPRKVDPTKVRRGFTHTAETRAKISASLRQRWEHDASYRANMERKTKQINQQASVRQKISESLKQKWQDPDFRRDMMMKMANRTMSETSYGQTRPLEHRAKISASMKQKWQEEEYRNKALATMMARRGSRPPKAPSSSTRPKTAASHSQKRPRKKRVLQDYGDDHQTVVRLMQPLEHARDKVGNVVKLRPVKQLVVEDEDYDDDTVIVPAVAKTRSEKVKAAEASAVKTIPVSTDAAIATPDSMPDHVDTGAGDDDTAVVADKKPLKDGSVSRLRQERRDLYDLLYGDEDEDHPKIPKNYDDDEMAEPPTMLRHSPQLLMLGDEDLDEFDPYGLQDS